MPPSLLGEHTSTHFVGVASVPNFPRVCSCLRDLCLGLAVLSGLWCWVGPGFPWVLDSFVFSRSERCLHNKMNPAEGEVAPPPPLFYYKMLCSPVIPKITFFIMAKTFAVIEQTFGSLKYKPLYINVTKLSQCFPVGVCLCPARRCWTFWKWLWKLLEKCVWTMVSCAPLKLTAGCLCLLQTWQMWNPTFSSGPSWKLSDLKTPQDPSRAWLWPLSTSSCPMVFLVRALYQQVCVVLFFSVQLLTSIHPSSDGWMDGWTLTSRYSVIMFAIWFNIFYCKSHYIQEQKWMFMACFVQSTDKRG